MLILELPFPPSANSYIRHSGNRRYFSPAGNAFLLEVMRRVGQLKKTAPAASWQAPEGFLEVTIELYPPNKRRIDTDNRAKPVGDALTKAGVWEDDWLVSKLTIERFGVIKGGLCRVSICKYVDKTCGN